MLTSFEEVSITKVKSRGSEDYGNLDPGCLSFSSCVALGQLFSLLKSCNLAEKLEYELLPLRVILWYSTGTQ